MKTVDHAFVDSILPKPLPPQNVKHAPPAPPPAGPLRVEPDRSVERVINGRTIHKRFDRSGLARWFELGEPKMVHLTIEGSTPGRCASSPTWAEP